MTLLRYDTRHVRAFHREGDFLKPLGFWDEFLPLAPCLFASASSIRLTSEKEKALRRLLSLLEKPPLSLTVTKDPFTFRLGAEEYRLGRERADFWNKTFLADSLTHTAACRFGLPHPGKKHLTRFFAELGVSLPEAVLAVRENGFFLPLEFLAGELYCFHKKKGEPSSGNLRSLYLLYDKNLIFAEEDARRVAYLIKKRSLILEENAPDLLFAADHGRPEGKLENFVLEERLKDFHPKLAVVNSCSLAQGGFETKISGACILSPYETEADKSVFAPLLRFLKGGGNRPLFAAFALSCIFYPNLSRFYRLYLPLK